MFIDILFIDKKLGRSVIADIIIDKHIAGKLRNNEVTEVKIADGSHIIEVKLGLFYTNELEITLTVSKRIELGFESNYSFWQGITTGLFMWLVYMVKKNRSKLKLVILKEPE